jgi:hypothetical protein
VLEDANNQEYNDPAHNAVWFPIKEEDRDGQKRYLFIVFMSSPLLFTLFSFPNLRIVKKTENELKNYGSLRVFDSPSKPFLKDKTRRLCSLQVDSFATSHASSPKELIKEFNLDRQQIAFTLGQKTIIDNILTNVAFASTTVFSEEVAQIIGRRSGPNTASTNPTTTASPIPKVSMDELYEYGPQKGYRETHDRIFVIYKNSLRPKRYGG